jgi:RNA polymerase-binding transcription factor DksA
MGRAGARVQRECRQQDSRYLIQGKKLRLATGNPNPIGNHLAGGGCHGTLEVAFLHSQLEERKRRLEAAIALAPQKAGFAGLLREVDSVLERMAKGSYGLCQECHETIEQHRLLADPLVCYCLDHLTRSQRAELERDLDLASQVQRNLLPQANLQAGGWDTSYYYARSVPSVATTAT